MTHPEFKLLAHAAGADVVFETSPCAVFKHANGLTVSVDIPSNEELGWIQDLQIVQALEDAGRVTGKVKTYV